MFRILNPKDRHTACKRCNYLGCSTNRDRYGAFGHWAWAFQWYSRKYSLVKAWYRLIDRLTALDYAQISDVEIDGIDTRDAPDFCDAFIASATYCGRSMSDAELDRLNSDRDYVYSAVERRLY